MQVSLPGAMMLARGQPDHDDAVRIIHHALDSGINYRHRRRVLARRREIVGKALADGRRDTVVLATKFTGRWATIPTRPATRGAGSSGGRGVAAAAAPDWIDLYQVHRWDPWTAHDETLSALTDLVTQGKIRAFGSSTYPAAQIAEAQHVARERRLGRYVTEQPPYSLLARGIEADVLPTCLAHGMGVIPWSPLNGGWLSGRWRKGQDAPGSSRSGMQAARYDLATREQAIEAAEQLALLAEEAGMSSSIWRWPS